MINFSTYLSRATFFHMFSVSAEDSSLATMWHSGISGLGSNWRSRSNLIGPAGCPEFVLMMSFLFLRGVRRVFTGEGILHLKNKNIYCFGLFHKSMIVFRLLFLDSEKLNKLLLKQMLNKRLTRTNRSLLSSFVQ